MRFEKLFQPTAIHSLTLKNRIIMSTLDPGFAGEGERVNQRLIDYFIRRAKGGGALSRPIRGRASAL